MATLYYWKGREEVSAKVSCPVQTRKNDENLSHHFFLKRKKKWEELPFCHIFPSLKDEIWASQQIRFHISCRKKRERKIDVSSTKNLAGWLA